CGSPLNPSSDHW
nr:immunoglobulin heavy chain junction region [Macaca mulatta]MOW78255.1 immunoglobulin heavy chain junction region [Macaca mulatta]MOW78961.1 immunoglobulin heavy chain junction region [Macaca mulatta]MOW79391.1 immunoglobulin heavy chain junction region [Macaca mulatta]MOW79653.1 immunoglobulin heavy chain junction region [Macaca mulatta]